MVENQEMKELEVRKQALLMESELNRLALQADCDRLTSIRNAVKPWAFWLAPLAGVAVAVGLRKQSRQAEGPSGRKAGWLGVLTKALTLAGPLIRFWSTRPPGGRPIEAGIGSGSYEEQK